MTFSNRFLTLVSCLVPIMSMPAHAKEDIVFMREDAATGKQIIMRDADTGLQVPITEGSDWHLYPDITSDGKKLTFVQGRDQNHLAVHIRDLTNEFDMAITPEANYLHPSFSGDGKYIAFSGPLGPAGSERIGVIEVSQAIKGAQPLVVPSTDRSFFPALASDGSFVVYQRSKSDGTKDIVEYHFDDGSLRPITEGTGKSMAPDLSFDDRLITYTSLRNGNWDVYVYDRMTGQETRRTDDPAQDFAPTFGRDGHLIFASDRSGRFALYSLTQEARAGSKQERLITGSAQADFYAPSISGDTDFVQRNLAPMPAPARSSFGAVEHRGRVYISGGHLGHEHTYPPESFSSNFEYFDMQNQSWHSLAPRNFKCHGFGIIAHGDYIYAFGGFAYSAVHKPQWKSLDVIERYSIRDNRWEVIGHMPRARSSNVVAKVGNKVYLIGGWDSTPRKSGDAEGVFHRAIDVFDLDTETMSESPHQIPDPLRRAFTGVVRDDKVILLGGLGVGSTHFELLDQATQFDPQTGAWTELPRLPFATFAPAAGVLGDDVFIFGGMFKTGSESYQYVNHVFTLPKFSTRKHSLWEHTGRYLRETKGFSMVVNLGQNLLGVLGGHSYANDTDAPVATFETFQR